MQGERALGVGRRVAGLRTSQGDVLRPEFSIITTLYLRILQSDLHKWPLPFRSCFTWWLVKIVCPQKRVLKHLLSGLQELQGFKGRGGDFFPIREEDSQGPLETGGKIFVHLSNKLLR